MQDLETIVYRTPLWKEALLLAIAILFTLGGLVTLYFSYTQGGWGGYFIGSLSLIFGLIAGVLTLSSNVVLRVTAEGVFAQPNYFKRRYVPWSEIERIEKSIQTITTKTKVDVHEQRIAHLALLLKRPDPGSLTSVEHALLRFIDPKNAADLSVKKTS